MEKPKTLFRIFYRDLPEPVRQAILAEAGIEDDRPSILRRGGGHFDEGESWIESHRCNIVPALFRFFDPPDSVVSRLVSEGDLQVPDLREGGPGTLSFSQLPVLSEVDSNSVDRIPVLDLALTSALVSELFVEMAHAARVCGRRIDPPTATVSRGSIKYTLGGGMFASGMGLLVACSAGLVGAPVVGPVAAASLAAAGVIDLTLGWKKRIAETAKTYSETRKNDAETKLILILRESHPVTMIL